VNTLPTTKKVRKIVSGAFAKNDIKIISSRTRDVPSRSYLPSEIRYLHLNMYKIRSVAFKVDTTNSKNVDNAINEACVMLGLSGILYTPDNGFNYWGNTTTYKFYAYID
jgi:hypothetical protein